MTDMTLTRCGLVSVLKVESGCGRRCLGLVCVVCSLAAVRRTGRIVQVTIMLILLVARCHVMSCHVMSSLPFPPSSWKKKKGDGRRLLAPLKLVSLISLRILSRQNSSNIISPSFGAAPPPHKYKHNPIHCFGMECRKSISSRNSFVSPTSPSRSTMKATINLGFCARLDCLSRSGIQADLT
jgi:hypothetical protein